MTITKLSLVQCTSLANIESNVYDYMTWCFM